MKGLDDHFGGNGGKGIWPVLFMLSGAYGTGKSSLALIYAKALLCAAPADGEPCDTCERCKQFGDGRNSLDFQRFEAGERSKVDEVLGLLTIARHCPSGGTRRVQLLDELHNLSRRAFDALLRIIEMPPAGTTFILVTSKPETLPAALRSRLTQFELNLLATDAATHFLTAICRAEGFAYEAPGLAVLQAAVGGQPRELLRALEKVAEYGPITETNVRLGLNLDFLDRLTAYARALLEGDLQQQLELIEDWPDAPRHKLEFLQRFFTFIYFAEVRHLRRDDPLMRGLASECRATLRHGMAQRAGRLRLDEASLWESALAVLSLRDRLSEHELAMVLSGFNRLLNPLPAPADREQRASSISRAPQRLRIVRAITGSGAEPGEYLSWNEVRPNWEAGSYLPQHYGVLLNLRLTIRPAEMGIQDHHAGADLLSRLTHELGMRVSEWRPAAKAHFHWIYRHEADAAAQLVTRLLISIPEEHLTAALHWLWTKFPALTIVRRNSQNPECQLRFHWAGIRALSHSLDPALLDRSDEGNRVPLVDLLRIPERWRGPAGTVHCVKRRGASQSLRRPARQAAAAERMPFLSALDDRAWQALDRGWELREHRDRLVEGQRRQDEEGRIRGLFTGADELTRARCAEEMARLRATYPTDPKERLRSWDGWWGTVPATRRRSPPPRR